MKKISIGLTLLLLNAAAQAQFSDRIKDGVKYYTDSKDSSKFVKFNMTSQVWMRYNENNPHTLVNGTPEENTVDASIRRIRFIVSGQVTDRLAFFMQFGQNSFNYLSPRKAGSFFHDVTSDYAIIKKHLMVGAGLNGWNGPSRFSNISTTSIMVLDPPGYQEVTNDTYDQFVRRLGFYVKGKLGKVDYRVSAGKPFAIQTAGGIDPISRYSTFSTLPPKLVYQGYVMYQFLDQESNFSPSNAGTYLGSKRIFNLGGGFYYQRKGMFRLTTPVDTSQQDIMLYSFDAFYDAPVNKEKGTAVSVYGSYSNYNFGQKFIKVAGADNPANGSNVANKTLLNKANFGNAFPYLGTGDIFYLQAGYKLKNNLFKDQGTLQFFANAQYSSYTRLNEPVIVADAGINWLLRGHNAKFTLDIQNRPYFLEDVNGNYKVDARKNSIIFQYQLAF